MNQRVTYQCTALVGTNKAGMLKANADGYYEVVLGALNVLNSAGEFYVLEPVKKLFESSSALMRKVNSGMLRGEWGHPKFPPGGNQRDFFMRVLRIDEPMQCCHISKLFLDYDRVKDANGNPMVSIIGLVKPSGPYGSFLQEQLDDPNQNVSFSIRSLVDLAAGPGGRTNKIITEIITWDYVSEPGISVANKYKAPGLEEYSHGFGRETVLSARELVASCGMGMESDTSAVIERTIAAYGLEQQTTPGGLKLYRPPSLKW